MVCTGNDYIHMMTSDRRQCLRIEMDDAAGKTRYAEYDNFAVGSEYHKYKLQSLGDFSGNAGQYNSAVSNALVNGINEVELS